MTPTDPAVSDFYHRWMEPLSAPLRRYHRFRVEGGEHIPTTGPALLVTTHSAATYDLFLAQIEIHRQTGRVIHGLGDDFWFDLPILRSTIGKMGQAMGGVRASHGAARRLLEGGKILGVSPGGTQEMIRPHTERFQVRWATRRGFVRLARETGAPIVLAACPAADLIYTVYPSRLTDWVYERWRLPFMVLRGWGPTLMPRPIPLTYFLSPPIWPPARTSGAGEHEIDRFHTELCEAMKRHLEEARRSAGLG